jgi:hypothetical protein
MEEAAGAAQWPEVGMKGAAAAKEIMVGTAVVATDSDAAMWEWMAASVELHPTMPLWALTDPHPALSEHAEQGLRSWDC